MVSVAEAEAFIAAHAGDYGKEQIAFESALGRVVAEDLLADQDIPPFNRVTMDGIALKFDSIQKGMIDFKIKGVQSAGASCIEIEHDDECIEIMTGAALPSTCDTVVRYEDITIANGRARIVSQLIKKDQNVHFRGSDKKQLDVVLKSNVVVTPPVISVAASIGAASIVVKKLPGVLIASTGDELVEVSETPGTNEIRSSNKYTIRSALKQHGIDADLLHLPDDRKIIYDELSEALNRYDVILLSGGVSKGKFDYVPEVLQQVSVKTLFHTVKQKPGKPFWFGVYNDRVKVFAFPGNPVSALLCLYKYFIPWLEKSLGLTKLVIAAVLNSDVIFEPALNFFIPVKLSFEQGRLLASPIMNNGSGDFTAITEAHAFLELPAEQSEFKKGEVYPILVFDRNFL